MWATLLKPLMAAGSKIKQGLGALDDVVGDDLTPVRGTPPFQPMPDLPQRPNIAALPPLTGLHNEEGQVVPHMGPQPVVSRSPFLTPQRPQPALPVTVPPEIEPQGPMPSFSSPARQDTAIPQLPGRPGEPRPYDPTTAAEYDYVMRGAKRGADGMLLNKKQGGGIQRDWKTSLRNALLGAAQGYRQTGDLYGALGGSVAGLVGSTLNPTAGRENVFNTVYRPPMEADARRQQQQQQQARQAAMDEARRREADARRQQQQQQQARQAAMDEARRRELAARTQMSEIEAQAYPGKLEAERLLRLAQARKAGNPIDKAAWGTYNTETGQPIWQRPGRQAEKIDEVEAERVTEDSLQGRMPNIIAGLPAPTRQILDRATVTENGVERSATQQEIASAIRVRDQAIEKERKSVRAYTRGALRRNQPNTPKPASGGASSVAPRNVNNLLQYLK